MLFTSSQATSRGRKVRMRREGEAFVPDNGIDTSAQAARSLASSAESLTEQVYDFVKGKGDQGATCDEVEVAMSLRHQTASSRMWDLEGRGRIRKTTDTRKARSGRNVRIYVAQAVA